MGAKIIFGAATAILSVSLLAGAADAGRVIDSLSDPLFLDKMAGPSIVSESDLNSQDSEWRALDRELSGLESRLGRDRNPTTEILTRVKLARSFLHRFFDFSARVYLDEPRTLSLVKNRLALNYPQTLTDALKKEIAAAAAHTFSRIIKKWEQTVDILLPPGLIFIKFYALQESMAREYGLPGEARGVAFPSRYIAVALRFDSQGRLIREELENTIRHELVHIFCYMALGFAGIQNLPTWFHEGVALELSGQTRLHHITQDAAGIHIMTITSTEEYLKYHRNFQYLREKYGNGVLLSLIRESLVKKGVAYEGLKTLSSQAEAWFKDKARFEWIAIIAVATLLAAVNLTLKRKRLYYSSVLVLCGLFIGSFTSYFRHSKGRYWFGFLIGLLLLHSGSRQLGAIRRAKGLLGRSERQERSGEYARAIASLKAHNEIVKSNAVMRLLLRSRNTDAAQRLEALEKKLYRQLMIRAADYEESLDFEKALECYETLNEILEHQPDETEVAQKNIARMRLLLELGKRMPPEQSDGPSDSGGS